MNNELQNFGELGLASHLKRLSDFLMKEIQIVYNQCNIDFDPYLFPIFKAIIDQKDSTITAIQEKVLFTQPAITQSVNKLKAKKLIDYTIDKEDKRKKLFRLSSKGKKMHQKMIPLWEIIDTQVKLRTEGSHTNLLNHLTHFENELREKPLSTSIFEEYNKVVSK